MPIRSFSISAALMGYSRIDDGPNKKPEILSLLSRNVKYLRTRLPDRTLEKTVKEMKAAGLRITELWLSSLEKGDIPDPGYGRLIDIANFYQVTIIELVSEDLSSKYQDLSGRRR